MKFYLMLLVFVLCSIQSLYAQIVGTQAYLKGNYVELGIQGDFGYEGADSLQGARPAAYHTRSGPTQFFGMTANPQMNNWDMPGSGTGWDGDFILPGSPENGWGFEIHELTGPPYATAHNNCAGPTEMSGYCSNYIATASYKSVDWEGSYTLSGYDIDFFINYKLNTNDLHYKTTFTLTNNSADTIPEFYYYRNLDPDNNQSLFGTFTTSNTIEAQPNMTDPTSRVSAVMADTAWWSTYIGLIGTDSNTRVCIGGFTNRSAYTIWTGSYGISGTVGYTNVADEAISLGNRQLNILPGESRTFYFYVVFDSIPTPTEQIEFVYEGSGNMLSGDGVNDTVYACGTVGITLEGPNAEAYNWVWTPNTFLDTDTGLAVHASPTDTITYYVTGFGVDTVEMTTTLIPALNPYISATHPGPVCNQVDLNSIVFSDTAGLANTGSWFLTEQPYNGYDLNAVVSGDFVYFPDSLYLMITDTITGCYDLESLHIQWQDPDFIIQTTPSSCVENTGTATVVLADTTSAVNILWSTGDTTFTVSGLGIDTITVLVTDSLTGCVKTGSAIILPNTFVVYAYTGYESCNSGNGTAYVEPFPNDSTAYYTYLWNTGDTTLAINNLVSGVYYYTVTNQYGCQVYDSIVVNDLGPQYTLVPVVTDASCDTCSDGSISVTLSGTFAPPVTYAWSTGATGTSITGLVPGMYWVTATDGNNCVVSSTSVVGYTTGMVTLSNNAGIHVFPNPANELVNIVSENTIDEITLYAVDGRSVLTSQVNATTYQLSLLSFSKGVYLLKVKSGFLSKTIRLVRN